MDRRTTIKWVLAVSAAWQLSPGMAGAHTEASSVAAGTAGYGTDPDLLKAHWPGDVWPLTLTVAQRALAGVLSDIIIPADEQSPGAAAVGVVDFIDEWVSAPYPDNQRDRAIVLDGLAWLDAEAQRGSGRIFAELDPAAQLAICDRICSEARAAPEHSAAARFFAQYRDLTAAAFYSSPVGRKDLGYIGNVPLESFEGPPPELLQKLNLP